MPIKNGDEVKNSDRRALASKRDETDGCIGHYGWREVYAANHVSGGAEADASE